MSKDRTKDQSNTISLEEKYLEAKIARRIVFITSSIVIILLLGIITGGYLYIKSALSPLDKNNNTPVEVEIPLGSSISTIASILEENKIIKDAKVFKYYVKFNNESEFQAGIYQLTPSMTLDQIIASLKTGKVFIEPKLTITIPEGLRITEIAKIISKKTGYTEKEIINLLNNGEFIEELMELYPDLITESILNENIEYPLEGYLFPATYTFVEEKPALNDIILPMIDKTNEVVMNYISDIESREMSIHEFLTMASLIEEEAVDEESRKNIASVFYNRLSIDMPLQTDPTVIYGMEEHKSKLTFKDYEINHPYNTYKIVGLPPGPIANAGQTSLEAALYPASTEYFYFLATKEGEVLFSKDYDEHLEKYNEHIRGE